MNFITVEQDNSFNAKAQFIKFITLEQDFGYGFLHKYRLGSLRMTPHGGHSFCRPRSHKRKIGLIPSTNQPPA